jgi:phosphatidylglycerophosphate synthase
MEPTPFAALIRWSEFQATVMLAAIGLALFRVPPAMIAAVPAISFGLLIAWNRGMWTPGHGFGAANAATLLRLLMVLGLLALPRLGTVQQLGLALFALVLDGVDGWLARRLGLCSEFGEYFDKEVDALFTVVLGMLLFREGLLGAWILIPGGLRYAFVLFVKFARPPAVRETGTMLGKVICVVVLSVLMACLLPFPWVRVPLAIAATLALCGSFLLSIRKMYRAE